MAPCSLTHSTNSHLSAATISLALTTQPFKPCLIFLVPKTLSSLTRSPLVLSPSSPFPFPPLPVPPCSPSHPFPLFLILPHLCASSPPAPQLSFCGRWAVHSSAVRARGAAVPPEFLRSVGSPVLYGHVVQLFHVSSGKFVSVKRTQSELEKSHLKVVLQRRGDMGSWFTVTPAYKIKREGEHVAFGDAATFMSVKFSGAGLRLSDASFDVTVSGCHPYVIDSREVNAGPEVGRWKLIPYALHESKLLNARHLLRGGDAVVVTHRASEMHLVCDEGQVFFEARGQNEPGGGRVSSNALWRLQPLTVEWGGRFASGDQQFHLKHLATGLYLESRRLLHSNTCLDMRGEDFRGMVGVTELYKKPGTVWRIGAVGQGTERHVIPYHTLIQCHGVHGYMSGGSGDYYKARWASPGAAGSLSFASSFSAAAAAAAVNAVGAASAAAAAVSSGFASGVCVDGDGDRDGGEEDEEEALMGRRPAGLTSVWDQKSVPFSPSLSPSHWLSLSLASSSAQESDSTRCLKNFVLALDEIDPIDDCTDDEVLKASIRTSGLIQVLFKYGPVVAEELQRLIRCLVISDMPDVLNLRGPPNRTYQVFVSEQKVLAVVVSVLQILLISKGLPQRCLSDCDTFFEGFDLRRLCKLMNRFLQAACQQFRPGQDQLAPYVPLLDQLVGNEIYTSGTIMAIFADNERIISRVTVDNVSGYERKSGKVGMGLWCVGLVGKIRQRVTNCRMFQRPRDIRFLNIICSSEGAPVRSNQNVVVDILRENADILVQARPAPSRLVRGGQTLILRRWDGLEVDCEAYADLQQLGPHSDSIRRTPQVTSISKLSKKSPSVLFLHFPSHQSPPPLLPHPSEVLFLFYVVSLELYCTLCLQRNRKAIDWLIEDSHLYGLDYGTLRMVVFNPALPFFLPQKWIPPIPGAVSLLRGLAGAVLHAVSAAQPQGHRLADRGQPPVRAGLWHAAHGRLQPRPALLPASKMDSSHPVSPLFLSPPPPAPHLPHRPEVLFLFYVVSLELYCTLCLQRNRKAIDWLIEDSHLYGLDYGTLRMVRNRKAIDWLIEDSHLYGLDYGTLRMVVFNPALPFFLRTNCCRLLTRMYLDREPFELVSQGSVMLTWPTIDDSDAETLSEPDHVNMAMADPFSAFPGKAPEREFGELKARTLAYLHSTRLSSACSAGQSALTLAVLQMASIMLQFGLFGNFSQVAEREFEELKTTHTLAFFETS
ncbi:unnamed protein product [Closterium sp. Yama58-4]|nr:unnamed protein product [Closterium sp. Yama58-4]